MKISPAQLRRLIIQETRKVLREAGGAPESSMAPETARSLDDYYDLLARLENEMSLKDFRDDPKKAIQDVANASNDPLEKQGFLNLLKDPDVIEDLIDDVGQNTLRGIAPQGPGGQHPPEEAPPTQRGGAHGFGPVKHNPANESYRRRYARNRTWFGR